MGARHLTLVRRLAELRQDTLWDMPTDDSSAMVLADPAPTTEQNRRNKKKLVWRKRSEISQADTLVVTPRELPVLAPVKNLQ